MAGSISVLEGAGAAYGFAGRSAPRAAVAIALAGLLGAAAVLALVQRDFSRAGGLFAGYLAAAVMARGALFRIAFAGHWTDPSAGPGWGGLQWGRLESRLLGVALLRVLLFGFLVILVVTGLSIVYVGLAGAESGAGVAAPQHWRKSLDGTGWTMMAALAAAGAIGVAWAAVRLSLAAPATVILGRVQLLSAWPLTRGRAWRIAGALALVLAPAVAVVLVGPALATAAGFTAPISRAVAVALTIGLAEGLLALPLGVGLAVYLRDRLGPSNTVQDAGAP